MIRSLVGERRKELGKTRRSIALHVGVTESTIINWESEIGAKQIAKVAKLCEALQCSPQDLIAE